MPCLEITLPKTDKKTKKLLATRLTEALDAATKFGSELFGIHFSEYEPGNAASGGNIWDGQNGRPYLHARLYIPRLCRSEKQKIVKLLTAAFTESLGEPEWKPVIHICEHPYDNVGVEGELLSDSYKACAESKFYYELPKD